MTEFYFGLWKYPPISCISDAFLVLALTFGGADLRFVVVVIFFIFFSVIAVFDDALQCPNQVRTVGFYFCDSHVCDFIKYSLSLRRQRNKNLPFVVASPRFANKALATSTFYQINGAIGSNLKTLSDDFYIRWFVLWEATDLKRRRYCFWPIPRERDIVALRARKRSIK